ncbi:histidinol-phosphatase [Saccharicrinis aurantiacus]|uniref:histidinol-phosphatase n=1 Tax=Saccharicrinis aurantiacus TaxID=1849719 RepID=UPI0024926ADC|nr:histidinol-phosphatase [Saccharicrinis aurantiacus]
MSWTNYHGHSKYCDGHGEIESYIQSAIKLGMPVLGVSSHAPVPFECFWTMKPESLSNYNAELIALQGKYEGKIKLLRSLEVDYVPKQIGPNTDYIKALQLDYIVGSIHFIKQLNNGEYWAIDGSFEEFQQGLNEIFNGDVKAVVQEFYRLNREMIDTQDFEIVGHLDKIKMHNATEVVFNETDQWYKNEVIETLKSIATKDLIVEINTKSLERNGLLFPGIEWFSTMCEMGIKVTINSDAHFPEKLIEGFEFVAEELLKAGYTHLSEYIDGQWQQVLFTKHGIQWN